MDGAGPQRCQRPRRKGPVSETPYMTVLTNSFSKRWKKLDRAGLQGAPGAGRAPSRCPQQPPAVTATPLLTIVTAALLLPGHTPACRSLAGNPL